MQQIWVTYTATLDHLVSLYFDAIRGKLVSPVAYNPSRNISGFTDPDDEYTKLEIHCTWETLPGTL